MVDVEAQPPWKRSYYFRPGYLLPTFLAKNTIETLVRDFEIRDDDVFLLSYARSGTAWVNTILTAIVNIDDLSVIEKTDIHQKLANIEAGPSSGDPDLEADGIVVPKSFIELWINDKPSPRVLQSHLQTDYLPKQFFQKKPKTVYIRRDPKDVLVSIFEHHKSAKYHVPVPWDKYFEEFLKGNANFGSVFEHTKKCAKYMDEPWWLSLTYEEIKKDTKDAVRRISKFLGKNLTDEQVDDVVRVSSFKEMKKSYETSATPFYKEKNAGAWQRKGMVGDWKNYLTIAQNKEFEKVYAEDMKGYEHLMYKY
ncbi:sulfotransferase 1A3-like isoform X1 [Ptychodera flava]|uniref:sulfotransferase 1A3-like isoform X1 n=1 Tax=Ptychodera flava TaxID=63121 RepID=UPI00396AAC3A